MYKASCEAFLVSEDTLIDYESLEVGRYVHSVGRANNNSLSLDINCPVLICMVIKFC